MIFIYVLIGNWIKNKLKKITNNRLPSSSSDQPSQGNPSSSRSDQPRSNQPVEVEGQPVNELDGQPVNELDGTPLNGFGNNTLRRSNAIRWNTDRNAPSSNVLPVPCLRRKIYRLLIQGVNYLLLQLRVLWVQTLPEGGLNYLNLRVL
jgi:hypothetical protein